MQLLTIVAMLFAAASVTFALQNNVPVTVTFLLWRFDSSLAMVLLVALALGSFSGARVSTPSTVRRQWTISRQRKRIEELEQACSDQKQKLAEMERRATASEPAAKDQPPYVGLKQLIAGGTSGSDQDRSS